MISKVFLEMTLFLRFPDVSIGQNVVENRPDSEIPQKAQIWTHSEVSLQEVLGERSATLCEKLVSSYEQAASYWRV